MKELKRIRKALVQQGWRIERRGSHDVAYPPDRSKRQVTLPDTPSDHRWYQNLVHQLRQSGFVWPWPPK